MSALPIPGERRHTQFPARRIAAGIVWVLGAYMTANLLWQLGVERGPAGFLAACLAQIVMTFSESPIWQRGHVGFVGWTMLGIDAFSNFGGMWSYVVHLKETGSWSAIESALGYDINPSPLIMVVLGIFASVLIAAIPEALWRE